MSDGTLSGPVSIIVPVLNEAGQIEKFLRLMQARASAAELVVVDGGSSDATRDLAQPWCDRLFSSGRGRGVQMNAGARAATGDVLWFVHSDAELPDDCLAQIERSLMNSRVVGGYFRVRLPRGRIIYRLTDSFAHYAGKLLRIRCGDHGFFCRRAVFEKVGGFQETSLMEDVDFYRAMRRCGKVVAISSRMIISPRRYETIGAAKLTFAYGLIATLYACGVSRRLLQKIYERHCVSTAASSSLNTWRWRSNSGLPKRAS